MPMFSVADESALFKAGIETRPVMLCQSDTDMIDLEFSDYARSPRFVAGWWIVPGLLAGSALLGMYLIG